MKKIKSTLWQGSGKYLSLFIAQSILLIISNMFLIKNNLDCDSAKLMTHIIKMWDHRTLVIPDWNYSTTIEWDCTSIFAIPFYAVTNNIFVSCGLANIVLTAIFLYAVFYLVKDKTKFLVTANILLIPFSTGMLDYFNMMFFGGSQYIVKVTVPIMMLGILLNLEEERKLKVKDIIIMVLYGLLLLCTAMSSGIYVLAAGIAAVVVGYILYKLRNFKRISVKNILFFVLSMGLYVLGMLVNQKVLGGSRGEGMKLCPVYEISGNIIGNFFGIFELAGGLTKEWYLSVFSIAGILTLAKFVFTVVLICTSIILAKKIVKNQLDIMSTILTVMFFWNVLIMFTVKTRAGSATTDTT